VYIDRSTAGFCHCRSDCLEESTRPCPNNRNISGSD